MPSEPNQTKGRVTANNSTLKINPVWLVHQKTLNVITRQLTTSVLFCNWSADDISISTCLSLFVAQNSIIIRLFVKICFKYWLYQVIKKLFIEQEKSLNPE